MIDPNTINLSTLTKIQLNQLISSIAQDQAAKNNTDFLNGWRIAKRLYPKVFAALNNLPQPTGQTAIPNDYSAIPDISAAGLASMGLGIDASLDEAKTCWTAVNGQPNLSTNADTMFDNLVNATAKGRNISSEAAASNIRLRHKNLATASDSVRNAKKLGAKLPPTSAPAKPVFSKLAGDSGPSGALPKSMGAVNNPFKIGKASIPGLANDGDVESAWDRTFPEPISDRDRGILKYIVNLLQRIDHQTGTLDAQSLPILKIKLAGPTVKEAAQAAADAAADALGNDASRGRLALANSRDDGTFLMLATTNSAGKMDWKFV
jgi:hypothetical protein